MKIQDGIWVALLVLIIAAAAVYWVRKQMKLRRARTWPKESGRVDSTSLTMEETGENQHAWFAMVNYSYSIANAPYSGFVRRRFILKKSADKWIAIYPNGASLAIRYDPVNPKDSVIFDDDQTAPKAS